jgi:protein-S-isoprenylcysteine O-methyltransferase Ste14
VPVDLRVLVDYLWVGIGLIWLLAALATKRTARRAPSGQMILHFLVLALAFSIVFSRFFRVGFLRARFVPDEMWIEWVGLAVAIAGFAFALWARFRLGGNWSGMAEIKRGHTLVRRGPYRLVRHPIYTGLTVALAGTALIRGELRGPVGMALALFEWKRKSLIEERMMIEQFGRQYADYRREVKALIPFVW